MTVLPTAHALVGPALQARIETQLTCYLKRLERLEIRNLQGNPELFEAALAALGAVGGSVDDDLDLDALDTVVMFALPAYNKTNEQTYPSACPETLPTEPVTVLDASSDSFIPDLLTVAARLAKGFPDGIDHLYAPSVRGGDAVHLMHLAAIGWHLTGDEAYKRFFEDDLVAGLDTLSVANTLGSLVQNPWCRPFYGDHITLPPLWAFLGLIQEGPVRDELVRALVEEGHGKIADGLANAKFDLMIADRLPDGDPLRDVLLQQVAEVMGAMGGNGGELDEPRRTYTLLTEDYEALLGDDFDPVALESLSFTAPYADTLFWTVASTSIPANFGVGLIGGTVIGALVASLIFGSFQWQSFHTPAETGRYAGGAVLMGIGGVLAGGCTVGAGLAGVPTLSIAALLAILSIAAGALLANAALKPSRQSAYAQPAE